MMAYLYRWRVKPGMEGPFQRAWSEITMALGAYESKGSALFQADDGTLYALARWPDDATRTAAFAEDLLPDAVRVMRDAVVETFQPVRLLEIANLWKQPL